MAHDAKSQQFGDKAVEGSRRSAKGIGAKLSLVAAIAPNPGRMADIAVAVTVHGNDGAFLKARIIGGGQGMRIVVVKKHRRRAAKSLCFEEFLFEKMIVEGFSARLKAFNKIARMHLRARAACIAPARPVDAPLNFFVPSLPDKIFFRKKRIEQSQAFDFFAFVSGKAQYFVNRKIRQLAAVILDPGKTFIRNGREQPPVLKQYGRGFMSCLQTKNQRQLGSPHWEEEADGTGGRSN